jgi:hypothetical protein
LQLNSGPSFSEESVDVRRLRETYVAEGGKLLTLDEIEQEVADRRGERYSEE